MRISSHIGRRLTKAVLLLSLSSALPVAATDIKEVWRTMPDSITPHLDKSLRGECVDIYDNKSTAKTTNKLKGESCIDTIAVDYLHATISKAMTLEMKLLPSAVNGDTVVCVVKTYSTPQQESVIDIYDLKWQHIRHIDFATDSLVVKPDTMSQDNFSQAIRAMDSFIVSAQLSAEDNCISVKANPLVTCITDMKIQKAICLLRRFKWDGACFK